MKPFWYLIMTHTPDDMKEFVKFTVPIIPNIADTTSVESSFSLIHSLPKAQPVDLEEVINSSTEAGATILVQDTDGEITHRTNKFYLTAFSYSFKEKAQLTETLQSPVLSFFGDTLKIYTFQGQALDYASQNSSNRGEYYHASSLTKLYNDILRGTKLVKNENIAIMKIANHFVYGYPLNLQVQHNGNSDKVASFATSWVVVKHTLGLAGVVTEQELEHMANPEIDDAAEPYLVALNNNTSVLNSLLDFRKWDKSLRYLGRISDVSFNQLQLEASQVGTAFSLDKLEEKIQAVENELASTTHSVSGGESSAIIVSHFGINSSAYFNNLYSLMNQLTKKWGAFYDDEVFSKFQSELVLLERFLGTLLQIKQNYLR